MRSLAELQSAFERAFAGGDAPLSDLKASAGMPASQRFDVYRNNVVSAQIRSLEGLYPALKALTGDDFFKQAARDYIRQTPCENANLLTYGLDMGIFLKTYPPLHGYDYLADVAVLEAAVHLSYVSAEADPLDPKALVGVDAENLRLNLHPSFQLLEVKTPASRIWEAALNPDAVEGPIDPMAGGEWLLIIRPQAHVEVRRLDEAGYVFISALAQGEALSAAYTAAIAVTPEFDLTQALEAHLSGGTFAAFV